MVNSSPDRTGKFVKKTVGRFDNSKLSAILEQLPPARKFWVGFSGGADSTALLLALHQCRRKLTEPIEAIHFHHGLNVNADAWLDHCREFCISRDIPFSCRKLNLQRSGGVSTEEHARDSRYLSVAELLGRDEVYLTAHHADDQAETLFLNLMRGSGVEGLAGIPTLRKLGNGWVARPLLKWRRSELEDFLRTNRIGWLEDSSNRDQSFDRNYLRHHLFPMLEARWPELVRRLNRTSRNARATSETLAEFINSNCGELLGNHHKMPLTPFLQLEIPLQALVLRQWLRQREVQALPELRIHEFLDQLAGANQDSRAEVRWNHWQLKLYNQFIWLQSPSVPDRCDPQDWRTGKKLELGARHGHMQLHGKVAGIPTGWQIDSRREGQRIRLKEKGMRQTLKELFRQSGIPPWLRDSIPVLYWNDEAVAVGDWIIADPLKTWLSSHKLKYCWHPADSLLSELRSSCQNLTVDP